jgi:hypothetical protein
LAGTRVTIHNSSIDAVAVGIAEVQRPRKVMIDDVACANNPAVTIGKVQCGHNDRSDTSATWAGRP